MQHLRVGPLSNATGQASCVVRSAISILLFAAAFFVLQRLTFALRFPPFERTAIWTPGGLLFAALLLTPLRQWWIFYVGLCLGAFAAYHGDVAIPAWNAVLAAQFHFAAVVLGTLGIRRYSPDPRFGNPAAMLVFVVAAGLVVPIATTAPIDVLRWANGADDVWPVALRSVLCIALGLMIATPALTLTLACGRSWMGEASWGRIAELVSLGILLIWVGHIAFGRPTAGTLPAMLYAPVPLLLWSALQFRLAGVCWAMLALAYQSTWGAIHGNGPFVGNESANNVLQLQLFLLAISLPLMFLAVVIEQRGRAFDALALREQQLRSQYAQLSTIYQTAPVGIAFVDTQLRFVSANDCYAKMNGIPAAAHLGRSLREVLPDLADELESVYRRVITTGQPIVGLEVHGVTAAQPEIGRDWLVGHYPVTDPQGLGLGVSTVVEEITERKRAEELKQELIHASRLALLGEFTVSIAHEINQPLGAIQSNADAAELLLDVTPPPPLDEVRQILADIRRDNLRASEVIRRLRNLFRKHELDFQPIDLNEIVRESVALVCQESRRRGVEIQVELADPLPLIPADRIHVGQVLINLLVNAMEAMEGTASASRITIRTVFNGQNVEVSVTDEGPGIPAERISHVFDHFFTTKKEGMGLGLAITRTLVEQHGGRIWAKNALATGATFQFSLPVHGEQPTEVSPLVHREGVR